MVTFENGKNSINESINESEFFNVAKIAIAITKSTVT